MNFSFEATNILMTQNPGYGKKDTERMNTILNTVIEQIKNISILLNPIIPISTKKF